MPFLSPSHATASNAVKAKVLEMLQCYYLRRRLASEGIVALGVTLSVCPQSRLYQVSTARRISLGGEGNALYPALSSQFFSLSKTHYSCLTRSLLVNVTKEISRT